MRRVSWTKQSIDDVKARATVDVVVGYDTKLKRDGDNLVGCCCLPGHKDDTPSLVVTPSKNVWHCKGCDRGGSSVDWLMHMHGIRFPEAMRKLSAISGIALVDEVAMQPAQRRCVARYEYDDGAGATLYVIERWEPGKNGRGKDFVQKHADGTPGKHPTQVLYRLGDIAANDNEQPVFVCEGEKAAEALRKLGLVATTHAGGASASKTWTKEFAGPLTGANVVLLPDNDEVGEKLMRHVAGVLDGLAASVTTVHLPVTGKGDDAVEWIAGGGTLEALGQLVRAAREVPAQAGKWQDGLRYVGRYLVGSAANLELILENDPALAGLVAYDDFASRVMLTRKGPWLERKQKYPRALVDHDTTRLRIYLERVYGVAFPDVGAVLSSVADRAAYNPLVDYLSGLKWDGKPRLAMWLTDYAGAADSPYVRAVARAWCISAVARAFEPGCKVDTTIVLEGTQGRGKSSLLRALVGPEWFLDHLPDFTSKDAAILVASAWVHELAELATLSRSEVEKIKQFLSQQVDVYRPPYGANIREVLRKCVFAATTNRDDYLRDATGNRRFWPVRTGVIDVAGVARDRNQLWAEAVHAYRQGEPWDLRDAGIVASAQAEAAERLEVIGDPWLAKIRGFAEARAESSSVGYVTVDECLGELGIEVAKRSQRDASRVKDLLRQMGWREERPRNLPAGRLRVWSPVPAGPARTSNGPAAVPARFDDVEPVLDQRGPAQTELLTTPHTTTAVGALSMRAASSAVRGVSPHIFPKVAGTAGPVVRGLSEASENGPAPVTAGWSDGWSTLDDDGLEWGDR